MTPLQRRVETAEKALEQFKNALFILENKYGISLCHDARRILSGTMADWAQRLKADKAAAYDEYLKNEARRKQSASD